MKEKVVVLRELQRTIIYTNELNKQAMECHVSRAFIVYSVNEGARLTDTLVYVIIRVRVRVRQRKSRRLRSCEESIRNLEENKKQSEQVSKEKTLLSPVCALQGL
jgi:hypothetical protein